MRQRFWFAAVLAVSFTGCGGSSSETPPPLQPDPHGFHYASTPLRIEEPDAGSPAPSSDPNELQKSPAPASEAPRPKP